MFYYDWTYLLVVVGAMLCMLASAKVNSTFSRFNRVHSASGYTGAQTAEMILRNSGIYDVSVEHISGNLTDHYDPSSKVLRLSDATYNSRSVAAIGVAAHECGHALQHHQGYLPLTIRSSLVPAANIGAKLGLPLVILGIILGMNQTLAQVGIWIFSLSVLFQIVTLPVEFNASSRAMVLVDRLGILNSNELRGCKKVLGAAALTYVAAAASSILQLLRLVLLTNRRDDS